MKRRTISAYAAIYDQVTQEILQELERGTKPWEAPWIGGDPPRNHLTLRYYSGINELILLASAWDRSFQHHRWLTAKQVASLGGGVRRSQQGRGTTVVFGTRYTPRTHIGWRVRGVSRLFVVFNIDQCEGVRSMPTPPRPSPKHRSTRLEELIRRLGIPTRIGGTGAFYNRDTNEICIPPQSRFFEPAAYYRTLLHEVAHAVMGPLYLNTPVPDPVPGARRAWSEIAAELVSAFVCRVVGVAPALRPADFIAEWLKTIRSVRKIAHIDPRWILEVEPQARAVSDHILTFDPGQ